ncbi:MAG: hypothetical protein JSS64_10205 [Bacteroidetes bacterium]|nr:hypothetical protein [Bacteroidota bacterium]
MKKITKCLSVAVLFLSSNIVSFGQHKTKELSPVIEIGANGSGFLYQGDLSDKPYGNFKDMHLGGGLYVKYYISPTFAVRANYYQGELSGNDADFQEEWRQKRAYKFWSPLSEFSIMGEADLFGRRKFASYILDAPHSQRWSVYANLGVGVAFVNAQRDWSKMDRSYFRLDAPDRIEQDSANKPDRVVFVIPAGLGIRYDLSKHVSVFAEAGYRFTFTDNLDGYKYSVFSAKYDGYTTYSLGFCLRFHSKKMYDQVWEEMQLRR